MEKPILALIAGIMLIFVTSAVVYDIRDHQDCDKKNGVYSRGVCFKKELIQE